MNRRNKNSVKWVAKFIADVAYILIMACYYIIKLIVNIFLFFIQMIMFSNTQYKAKSGNSFLKTYFDKGHWGEYQLYRRLIKVFGEDKLLTNIYLPSKNVDNTEIDVLGVHNGIIYCYEVKNYSGYIYGKEGDKYWTQVLRFRTKNKFYNPLRQNYAHSKALAEYLEIEEQEIVPIVVFGNRTNLSNVFVSKATIYRINTNFTVYENATGSLDDSTILSRLTANTNVDQATKNTHVEQIQQLKL